MRYVVAVAFVAVAITTVVLVSNRPASGQGTIPQPPTPTPTAVATEIVEPTPRPEIPVFSDHAILYDYLSEEIKAEGRRARVKIERLEDEVALLRAQLDNTEAFDEWLESFTAWQVEQAEAQAEWREAFDAWLATQ
jgi:hypothetical protein